MRSLRFNVPFYVPTQMRSATHFLYYDCLQSGGPNYVVTRGKNLVVFLAWSEDLSLQIPLCQEVAWHTRSC